MAGPDDPGANRVRGVVPKKCLLVPAHESRHRNFPWHPARRTAARAAAPTGPAAPATGTVGVLHLINGEHYAGAERVQDLLAKCLPAFGYRVGFACLKLNVFGAMRQSHDAPLWDVPMRTKFDLRAAARVARLVRQQGVPHPARPYRAQALVGGGRRRAGRRAAGVSRPQPHAAQLHPAVARRDQRRRRAVEPARASQVIAVSQAMAEEMGRGCDRRRIAVVSNGVPPLAAVPARQMPRPPWTLGMVALFRPRKGTEVLLEAMALLGDRGVPVRLRAVGTFESPGYEAEIAARIRSLGLQDRVQWTGFARNVTAELLKMDLLGPAEPVRRGPADGGARSDGRRRAGGGHPRGRHGRGRPPRPRRAGGRAGRCRRLAAAIADMVEGRRDWAAMRSARSSVRPPVSPIVSWPRVLPPCTMASLNPDPYRLPHRLPNVGYASERRLCFRT